MKTYHPSFGCFFFAALPAHFKIFWHLKYLSRHTLIFRSVVDGKVGPEITFQIGRFSEHPAEEDGRTLKAKFGQSLVHFDVRVRSLVQI